MSQDGSGRVFGLDFMRAMAILMVVYAHGHSFVANRFPTIDRFTLDAVTLFFVLSGFLIGRILLRDLEAGVSWRALSSFWARRWMRTLPAYFVVLTVLLVVALIKDGRPPSERIGLYYLFSQNIASPHPPFFGEAWSLSVEEWFYLTIPLLVYVFAKTFNARPRHAIVALAIAIVVGTPLVRVAILAAGQIDTPAEWDSGIRKLVVTRLDSLMLGVMGAYVSLFYAASWRSWPGSLFGIGLGLLILDQWMLEHSAWRNYFQLTVAPLGSLLLLPLLSSWKAVPHPVFRVFTFISLISYSLYLVHFAFVKETVVPLFSQQAPTAVLYVAYWVVSVAVAYLSWRFVERPFLRLRDQVSARQGRNRAAATPLRSEGDLARGG